MKTVPFAQGKPVGKRFLERFNECDAHNSCDGGTTRSRCSNDSNRATTLLELPHNVLFFDAKLAIDADGSPLARNDPGKTDQKDTSLRYPLPKEPSVDADKVPYIVVPQGGFMEELGVKLGDLVAVVYQDKLAYAIVGDEGPKCKIGEGSIELHQRLKHAVCRSRNAKGECTRLHDESIEKDVLYFIFRGSNALVLEGLTPANINTRIQTEGAKLMQQLQR